MHVSPTPLTLTDWQLFQAVAGSSAVLLPDTPTFTIASVTDDFLKTAKLPKTALIGQGLFEIFRTSPDEGSGNAEKQMRASLEHVLLKKEQHSVPLHRFGVTLADGTQEERYWSTLNRPVLDDAGKVVYIIHTVEEVTDNIKVKSEVDQLKDIQRTYQLFMQAPVAVCIVRGSDYVVQLANEQMLQLLGRTPAMVGKPIEQSLTEARVQGLLGILDDVRSTGKTFHAPDFPAELLINGVRHRRYFDLVFQPYFQDAASSLPTAIFCVAYNVTNQVSSQKQLEETKAETERQKRVYEAITSSTPDLMYVFDRDYRFTYANEALLTMWGKSRDEAIGRKLLENGYEPWHAEMHEREIDHVIATKQPIRGEVSFPHAVLGKRIYDYILVPVLNQNGEVEAIAGTTRDITEIKKAEEILRQSQEKLEALVAERTQELQRSNQDLEAFAYAASHDLKEPVRKIKFFSERLKNQLQETLSTEQERFFNRLENATSRMGSLIDDLLTYSQATRGMAEKEEVDLNKQVQLVLEDLELEVQQKHADIVVEGLPTIKGDRRQIQQLFQNLIGNALKYSKPNTATEISVTSKKVNGKDLKTNLAIEHRDRTFHLIEVRDNGIGFPPEEAERIFKIFTRLHGNAEYGGTGIGLSIVQKVVQNHDGTIWAESAPGNGATFKMLIPVT
jgi:hypothetical protein